MKAAYVTLLYNAREVFLDTVIFAASLRATSPQYPLVLLCADPIPPDQLDVLSRYYDQVIPVFPLKVKEGTISEKCPPRLLRNLEKLHALTLTQFDKVLLCDSDMLVIQNIDHLFSFDAPAAMALDEEFIGTANTLLPRERALERYKNGQSFINAGLMLLRPDQRDFCAASELLAHGAGTEAGFILPDQDFLSGFYAGQWHSISYLYNFRPIDIVSPYAPYLRSLILGTPLAEVFVIHYAGSIKPVHYLQPFPPEALQDPFAQSILAAVRRKEAHGASMHGAFDVQLYSELIMLWIMAFFNEYHKLIAQGIDLAKPGNLDIGQLDPGK